MMVRWMAGRSGWRNEWFDFGAHADPRNAIPAPMHKISRQFVSRLPRQRYYRDNDLLHPEMLGYSFGQASMSLALLLLSFILVPVTWASPPVSVKLQASWNAAQLPLEILYFPHIIELTFKGNRSSGE